jgi:tetratricopeptide (TPR) repeat protein
LLNVADADAAGHHPAAALQGYAAAAQFAQQLGDPSLQSLALAHAAEVHEQAGDLAGAAAAFQQALALDEKSVDGRNSAVDWFNYAQFLHRQKQPEMLVLACLLKSVELLSTSPGEEQAAAAKAEAESEARLGEGTRNVRAHLADFVRRAVSLPASVFNTVSH